jgi:hypothetical protein
MKATRDGGKCRYLLVVFDPIEWQRPYPHRHKPQRPNGRRYRWLFVWVSLLFGFTLAVAVPRFTGPRTRLVQKASGTTYLRSGTLPSPTAITRVGLLRHDVDARSISTTLVSMRLASTRRRIVPNTHLPELGLLTFGWIRDHKRGKANCVVMSAISRKESGCERATGHPVARRRCLFHRPDVEQPVVVSPLSKALNLVPVLFLVEPNLGGADCSSRSLSFLVRHQFQHRVRIIHRAT